VLRLLVPALACATILHAVDPEDHVRKSAPVNSATRLVLNADIGTIRVQPGIDRNVAVDVSFRGSPASRAEFDRMRRDFTLDITQQGSDIRVNGAFHRGWEPLLAVWPFSIGSWLREVAYRVTVPEKFNAEVETSAGAISVSNLKGEVTARTSGGSLNFDGIEGAVNASTSGGPILIERNLGRVKARTSGGGIEIREAKGAIDASTSGGGVSASLIGQPKEECRLDTSGGNISVSLSRDVHLDLDASASGGEVSTNFAVARSQQWHEGELRTRLNGGGPLLYLRTSGGAISVRHTD
jgi:Putative adhesin